MDPKATAKSKRIHSLHGRKNHPSPASIAQKKKPSATQSDAAAGGAVEEKPPRRRHEKNLPSNWDRYDDDEAQENQIEGESSTPLKYGEAVPKSKGADFRYLVDQARAQPQEFQYSGSTEFNSNELSFDFMQGLSSIISARGKSLLSSCKDDDFIIDDEPSTSFEVPYLSLDLNALAAQLSKLRKSQRLFIEPDLLPEEQYIDESESTKISQHTNAAKETIHDLEPSTNHGNKELGMYSDNQRDIYVSRMQPESILPDTSAEKVVELDPSIETNRLSVFDQRINQASVEQFTEHNHPDSEPPRTSRFDVATAEAELDMLLSSLQDTTISDSVRDDVANKSTHSSSLKDPLLTSLEPNMSRTVATNSTDDVLDDLLLGTSISLNNEKVKGLTQMTGVVPSGDVQPTPSTMSSRPMDDFNSWFDSL